jgi:hypothetical protein
MKRILLYSISAAMAALVLSSYNNGPWNGGNVNRTGSAGTAANCSGAGCHVSNTANTQVTIGVLNASNQPVTSYVPGTTYKVQISAGNTTASLPKCGFQAACVKSSNTSAQAGTFTSTASNISVRNTGSLQLVEHNAPIAAIASSGTNNVYALSFNWTAPPAGTGKVRFYTTFNAVNNNGNSSGDQPNAATPIELDEGTGTTGISKAPTIVSSLYPNPVQNELHFKMNTQSGSCMVAVMDMTGRIVISQVADIENKLMSVNTAKLEPGSYLIRVSEGGGQFSGTFVKQ